MEKRIGFIGSGQMARALAAGFVASGQLPGSQIHYFNPGDDNARLFSQAVAGSQRSSSAADLISGVDQIWMAVKPQVLPAVLQAVQGHFRAEQTLVSVAAGVTLQSLAQWSGTDRVVRVMPNTPSLVGRGVSVYACHGSVEPSDQQFVHQLLQAVGWARQVPEKLIDPVTGLSGSGPAFMMTVLEALADGAVQAGVPRAMAAELAIETMAGAAQWAQQTRMHPATLRDQVASPAGTTIYGLAAMEDGGVRAGLIRAVLASSTRAKELA